ncbi:MAG: NAD(P)-binding domain-containing protein [Pseudolysinimonas sp.]
MPSSPPVIGILGAGKVGTVLARLALAAGHRVLISASGSAERIALIIEVLAPGAEAATTPEVIEEADVIILALPLGKVRSLPVDLLVGKLVIDSTNFWEPVDGHLPEFTTDPRGTSEVVADLLPGARVVKAFSHLGYHDLDERGMPTGAPGRVALAIAGDDKAAVAEVAQLVDDLGFEPIPTGPLATGRGFQAHTKAFGYPLTPQELRDALGQPIAQEG